MNLSFSETTERTRQPRKWNLPLTYEPKIQPVIDGTCWQTIRVCNISKSKKTPGSVIRKSVGDLIRFYVWEGVPYRSKRKTITEYTPLKQVLNCIIYSWGIQVVGAKEPAKWDMWQACALAELDGIIPATGEALRDVLIGKNGNIPENGWEAQILRW